MWTRGSLGLPATVGGAWPHRLRGREFPPESLALSFPQRCPRNPSTNGRPRAAAETAGREEEENREDPGEKVREMPSRPRASEDTL